MRAAPPSWASRHCGLVRHSSDDRTWAAARLLEIAISRARLPEMRRPLSERAAEMQREREGEGEESEVCACV